jgi:hypothetical protein
MATMVKSVELVDVTQGSSSTSSAVYLTKGQNYENCVPFMTLKGCSDYMDSHCMDVYFSGTTESGVINFQRNEHNNCAMYIKCYVVEFDSNEVRVQQGSFSSLGTSETNYTLGETIDTTKSAVVHYWSSTSDARTWGIHMVRAKVVSSTQVSMYRALSGGTVSGHYFLFEDISTNNDHFTVSHQSANMTTSTSKLIPEGQQDITRTFVLASYTCNSNTGEGHNARQTVRVHRNTKVHYNCNRSEAYDTVYYNMQIVCFVDQSKIYVMDDREYNFGTTATSVQYNLSWQCNPNLSTPIHTLPFGATRGLTNNISQIDSLWTSLEIINNGTQLEYKRNSSGGDNNSYFGAAVVDWGGIVIDTGSNPTPLDPDLSFVKSVENFRLTVGDYHNNYDLTKGQDASNCALFVTLRGSSTNNEFKEILSDVWIREPGVVLAHRPDAAGDSILDVSVVEFYPDQVKVQMVPFYMWGVTTDNVDIEAVSSTDRAFIIAKWQTDTVNQWARAAVRLSFADSDTVTFYKYSSSSTVIGTAFVIEDLGDNFRVSHDVGSSTATYNHRIFTTTNVYHDYYNCLPIGSFTTTNDNIYSDRSAHRIYHHGGGGQMTFNRDNGTGTVYYSAQYVRFLNARRRVYPRGDSYGSSTTTINASVSSWFSGNDWLTPYNPNQMSVGRTNDTNTSTCLKAVFETTRLTSSNTNIEMSREATGSTYMYRSYGGVIDWIGYSGPYTDADHNYTYTTPTKSLVRSVEKFTYNGNNRLPIYFLSKGQVPENCVPFSSKAMGSDDGAPQRLMRMQRIDEYGILTSVATTGDSGGDLDEVIYVVEFDPDQVKVQQIFKASGGTSFNITIPEEVNISKTFMIFNYCTDAWSEQWAECLWRGDFTSSTQLTFTRNTDVGWVYLTVYLVEALQDQWVVSHKTAGNDSDENSYDYQNWKVKPQHRMIQGSYTTDNTNYYCDRSCYRLYPRMDHGFQWNRNNSTNNQTSRALELVDFNDDLDIMIGGYWVDIPSGDTSETKATMTDTSLDLDRSIVFPTIVNDINRVDGTDITHVGSCCVKFELTDVDEVTCTRYDKSVNTYGWFQWVQWPPFKTHYFEGTVTEKGVPVERTVSCFRADTNELMDSVTSTSGTGAYHLETSYSGTHYIVCQDDDPPLDYNHLVLGKMTPYPIT